MAKKAQAAMEFLITYGWAIIVIFAAIGALAYFGVLSPGKFLPEKCEPVNPSVGVICSEHSLTTSTLTLVYENTNPEGKGINITAVNITLEGQQLTATVNPTYVGPQGKFTITADVSGLSLSSGKRATGTIEITYKADEATLTQKASGELKLKVQ